MAHRSPITLHIALAVLVLPLSTHAQEALSPAGLRWSCTQQTDEQFHVACVPASLGPNADPSRGGAATQSLARDMRPVAQRGDAEVFSADAWRVPLHSRPTDPAFVQTLLESVLCGKHASCTVQYRGIAANVAQR